MIEEKDEIRSILKNYNIIAIIGLSKDLTKESYKVAKYLKDAGYRIIPINPFAEEILEEKCYKSLLEMPEEIKKIVQIVDIFRPSQELSQIVDQAIRLREDYGVLSVIWTQLGIENEEAAKHAENAGLMVVMNKCMMTEYSKLINISEDKELETIKMKKMDKLIREAEKSSKTIYTPILISDNTFDRIIKENPFIIIDCWAPWCGPCRMIAPVIEELAKDYSGKVIFAKLNTDENPEISTRFEIMSIPTLLFIKDGKEINRIIGAVPKSYIEETLLKYIKSNY